MTAAFHPSTSNTKGERVSVNLQPHSRPLPSTGPHRQTGRLPGPWLTERQWPAGSSFEQPAEHEKEHRSQRRNSSALNTPHLTPPPRTGEQRGGEEGRGEEMKRQSSRGPGPCSQPHVGASAVPAAASMPGSSPS